MTEREMFPASVQSAAADVMVTLFDEEGVTDALRLAARPASGAACASRSTRKPTSSASSSSTPRRAASLRHRRRRRRARGRPGHVKNMETGEQTVVPRDQAAAWLAERTLNPEPAEP